jgi:hypothetical protein
MTYKNRITPETQSLAPCLCASSQALGWHIWPKKGSAENQTWDHFVHALGMTFFPTPENPLGPAEPLWLANHNVSLRVGC